MNLVKLKIPGKNTTVPVFNNEKEVVAALSHQL